MNDNLFEEEKKDPERRTILRKAFVIGASLIFFSLILFVVFVTVVAKWATKGGGQ